MRPIMGEPLTTHTVSPAKWVTRPGANGFPDATFDYILYRGFKRIVSRKIYQGSPVSDHNLVTLRLK